MHRSNRALPYWGKPSQSQIGMPEIRGILIHLQRDLLVEVWEEQLTTKQLLVFEKRALMPQICKQFCKLRRSTEQQTPCSN